jgi:hypothetical protein
MSSCWARDDLADHTAPEACEADHRYQGGPFWPAAFRNEVLARLLDLNRARAEEERRLGPSPRGAALSDDVDTEVAPDGADCSRGGRKLLYAKGVQELLGFLLDDDLTNGVHGSASTRVPDLPLFYVAYRRPTFTSGGLYHLRSAALAGKLVIEVHASSSQKAEGSPNCIKKSDQSDQ